MRKLFGKYFLYFAGVNLLNFLLFYVSTYLIMNDYVEYARYFIGEAVDFALPVVSAALVAIAMAKHGFRALWLTPIISLGKIAYAYPYYYLYFIDGGLLTDESLLVALPSALATVIIDCLAVCLLSFVIYLVTELVAKHHGRSFGECVGTLSSPFDFSEELAIGIFSSGAIIFAVNFVFEVIDTVEYIVNYRGTYQLGEVIYITVSFIILLAELLLGQLVAVKLAKKQIND